MPPLITVGLPVYNAMPYLCEAMESLLAQTHRDFEILAINDGSTDESLEYLHSVRDRRLRVLSQKNCGLTSTLNRMLTEVNSPWLARHDADDVAHSNRLARTLKHIVAFPQAGMFYSLAEYYPPGSVGDFRSTQGTPENIRDLVLAGYLPSFCHPSVTLNVAKVIQLGGYRFDLDVEDIDLWWRMALNHDIQFIPEVLVGFRQNSQSVSSNNLEQQAVSGLYVQYLLLSHLCGLQPLDITTVRPTLLRFLDVRKVQFKNHMRAFNIELGRRNRLGAWKQAARAFVTSPTNFFQRLRDEFDPHRMIRGGADPAVFLGHQTELWPNQHIGDNQKVLSLKH